MHMNYTACSATIVFTSVVTPTHLEPWEIRVEEQTWDKLTLMEKCGKLITCFFFFLSIT
jgi:hypothetical protein